MDPRLRSPLVDASGISGPSDHPPDFSSTRALWDQAELAISGDLASNPAFNLFFTEFCSDQTRQNPFAQPELLVMEATSLWRSRGDLQAGYEQKWLMTTGKTMPTVGVLFRSDAAQLLLIRQPLLLPDGAVTLLTDGACCRKQSTELPHLHLSCTISRILSMSTPSRLCTSIKHLTSLPQHRQSLTTAGLHQHH